MHDIMSAVDWRILQMLQSFAETVIASRPFNQLIEREGDPYIERWFLLRKNIIGDRESGHTLLGLPIPSEIENLYLHRYVRADVEEPHCHPWPNATLVLSGWYEEEVHAADGTVTRERRNPGDVVLRDASEVHAIVATGPNTISLFATAPKMRDWGFHTEAGFIPWQDFRAWKQAQTETAA